jgi:ParB family chromosome partitioning protein
MAQLIKAAKSTVEGGLKKAADADHDPADLNDDGGARLARIPLDQLTYNPENPRDEDLETDPETLELAESMKLIGQQQSAVIVSRDVFLSQWPQHADTIKTQWVLMIGNRRKAAATLNGWTTLECTIRHEITGELADLPIHENLHRKGINPLRMAYYLADQVKLLGGERAVAKKVGKTQPWVNQLLKLLKLVPELQALIRSGEINATTGRALAKLTKSQQRDVWAAVAELDDAERAEFWATGGWTDKRFIGPPAVSTDDEHHEPAEPTEAAPPDDSPAGDDNDAAREKAVSVLIPPSTDPQRLPRLAAALRKRLTADEVVELAEQLAQPA